MFFQLCSQAMYIGIHRFIGPARQQKFQLRRNDIITTRIVSRGSVLGVYRRQVLQHEFLLCAISRQGDLSRVPVASLENKQQPDQDDHHQPERVKPR